MTIYYSSSPMLLFDIVIFLILKYKKAFLFIQLVTVIKKKYKNLINSAIIVFVD